MKYTKEQIVARAKIVIKDIWGEFYTETCIDDAFFKKEEQVDYGKYKGKIVPCWIVSVHSIFDNFDFLTISDEDGEPLFYQNFNTIIFEILKDEKGKYYKADR